MATVGPAVTYTLAPATQSDVLDLIPRLRDADRREVLAFGQEPLQALLESLSQSSEAYTVRAGGEMMCMTGVCPMTAIGQTGVPWLLGTDLVRQHARYFMAQSRRLISRWLAIFPVLENRVPTDYAETLRWARWLGFKVEAGQPFSTIRLEAA